MPLCNDSPVTLHSRILVHQDSEIMKQTNLQCRLNADANLLVVFYVNCFFGLPEFTLRTLYTPGYCVSYSSPVNCEFLSEI